MQLLNKKNGGIFGHKYKTYYTSYRSVYSAEGSKTREQRPFPQVQKQKNKTAGQTISRLAAVHFFFQRKEQSKTVLERTVFSHKNKILPSIRPMNIRPCPVHTIQNECRFRNHFFHMFIKITQKDVEFMRKKIFFVALSIVGIFIIYFGIAPLNISAEKNINPPKNNAFEILEKIKSETQKYTIGTYNINSNIDSNSKAIDIEIIGSQEYYDSVKNEVKELVINSIKSTEFEGYTVNVNKSKINKIISEETREGHRLMRKIFETLNNEVSETYPEQIDQIDLAVDLTNETSEFLIEIKTSLNKNQKPPGVVIEIENKVKLNLEKKLSSNKLIKERPVKIYIYNKHGKKIN